MNEMLFLSAKYIDKEHLRTQNKVLMHLFPLHKCVFPAIDYYIAMI